MEQNKVKCPECGALIELKPKEGNPDRLIAFHNCGTGGERAVYETDAQPAKPAVEPRKKGSD